MFSVDNTDYSYSCYITTDNKTSSQSYSAKGSMNDAEEGAIKFLEELNDILQLDDEAKVAEESHEVDEGPNLSKIL